MTTNSLAKLEKANQMLSEIKTVDDAKKLVNLAEAARVYAREAELGLEAQNHAAEIKLRAQRRAGEILLKIEKGSGRPSKNLSQPVTNFKQDTYNEIDITRQDASRWQQIAQLPAKDFENYIETAKDEDQELTTNGALRLAKEIGREDKRQAMKDAPNLPDEKYRIVYADPPWQYNDSGVITENDNYGHAERHYPTMRIDQLCLLPIKNMIETDAVLFLWTTSPLLEDSFKVIHAWGFEYKTSFVWDKVKHNFGHYNSVRHEFLLVCTRGSCTPDNLKLFDSVQSIERTEKHSEKPEEFRAIIDELYLHGKRVELFARATHDGWDSWGNEA